MEEEPHKIEAAESKSNKSKSKSVKITRELSKPILASPCPKKPNKADPTGTIEISDTPANVQYERRLKYKNESQGSRVAENQRRVVNEELEFPKKRSIIDDNTNKDVPPKFRRATGTFLIAQVMMVATIQLTNGKNNLNSRMTYVQKVFKN
ncbi:hypothetical protein L2E82_46008 [Cichorium intybus]|uniref:Uncharacterized protein n=1 Tax=Cichorium intybus TaxID=13427 RepID=A0ACB8ZTN1_CICIN|nr:hypothetical protein L2E82_46008 [Cichorium intybus]